MVLITVGGPPGSGTTTVCRLLQDRTGLDYVYAGKIFRDLAKERGISLERFSDICEEDESIDRNLDKRMLARAIEGDVIIEGRMIGPLIKRENIDGIKVYIKASLDIRAARVMERDGGHLEKVKKNMAEREESEMKRYIGYYGIDPSDEFYYDLVLDSSEMKPDEEVDLIIAKMNERFNK